MVYPSQNLIPVPGMLAATDYYLDPASLSASSFAVDYTNTFESSDTAFGVMEDLVGNMISSELHRRSSSLYLINEKFGHDKEIIEFPDHQRQTFLQLLEENNMGTQEVQIFDSTYLKLPVLEEATNRKALESAPKQLRVQLQSSPDQAATHVVQPEGLTVTIDSQCSQALSCNALPRGSNQFGAGFTKNVEECNHQEYVAECDYQESGQSRSASSSEKSQKDGRVNISTHLPFSGGQSQSSYKTENHEKRPKRKRTRSRKNIEEVESQRQTHIAVERNRRKQMNEYLSILRSLMPVSYVPRGDQASIVGGAIDFVKELEQVLEYLQEQKRRIMYTEALRLKPDLFWHDTFPLHHQQVDSQSYKSLPVNSKYVYENFYEPVKEIFAESKSEIAEVEVQMIGRDTLVKVLTQRMSGQLQKAIASFENLGMTIMHANISTVEQTVLYSLNVKLERACHLGAADELAALAQQIFQAIHESA